jgi:hypothetical protein
MKERRWSVERSYIKGGSSMRRYCTIFGMLLTMSATLLLAAGFSEGAEQKGVSECWESREIGGYAKLDVKKVKEGLPNVKCSDFTGGVLWYGDPYTDTVPMGKMPTEEEGLYRHEGETTTEEESLSTHRVDYLHAEAVVRERIPRLKYYPCTFCHNGTMVKVPEEKDKFPHLILMHKDIVPDSLQLRHGHGRMWCLDCHSAKNRNVLVDHRGQDISYDQSQLLCGKCHGPAFNDWRKGIHGKRIGEWDKNGKKRWWTCTECHNPHQADVRPYHTISPERAPVRPKGMKRAKHEESPHN